MTLPDSPPVMRREQSPGLEWPLLLTLAYADVFDFPMTAREAHRYLIGRLAGLEEVAAALGMLARSSRIELNEGHYSLPGRSHLIQVRRHRAAISTRLWKHARRYGGLLAALPFVRLVAVSGALALHNTDGAGDVDYFLVTAPGRLWLARAMSVMIVRLAARRGVTLCPNYLLTTPALALNDWNLFTAHEAVQMVPLAGHDLYRQLRSLNRWTDGYLPNAAGPPRPFPREPQRRWAFAWAERAMQNPLFGRLEHWEMDRKVRKFGMMQQERAASANGRQEIAFGEDCCKGHLDYHGARTMRAFQTRVLALKEALA